MRIAAAGLVAFVAAFAVLSVTPAARAASDNAVVHVTLAVHSDQVQATPVETALVLNVPLSWPNVRKLLADTPGTRAYYSSLCGLLTSVGLVQQKELATALAAEATVLPRVQAGDGRLKMSFFGTRDLAAYLPPYTFIKGTWMAERRGADVIRFWLPSDAKVPRGVVWNVDAYVGSSEIVSTSPTPDERNSVDGLPRLPEGATPQAQTGNVQGKFAHVGWVLNGAPSVKRATVCNDSPVVASPSTAVQFQVRLPRSARILMTSYGGLRGHIRLAVFYIAAMIFFLPLAWLVRRWKGRDGSHVRRLLWIGVAVWLATLGAGIAGALIDIRSPFAGIDQVRPALIAAGAVSVLGAVAASGLGRWLMVALAGAAAAAGFAQSDAFNRSPGWGALSESGGAALVVALSFLAVLALLTWRLVRTGRKEKPRWLPHPWLLAAAVVIVGALLVAQAGSSAYRFWETRDGISRALNPGSWPGWHRSVADSLLFFPVSLLSVVASLLPLLGFAVALGLLGRYAVAATSTYFESENVGRWLVMVVFAAFVVGTSGSYYGWRVPLAFFLALGLWKILPRRTIEAGAGSRLIGVRDNRLARAQRLSQSATGRIPVLERALGLNLGPGGTWLENGRIATRLGAWLAVVPVGFFVYVLLTDRIHDFSPWTGGGGLSILRSIVYELVFWVAASFTIGALFAELPGWRGALKGGLLGLVYLAAVGLSVWILPGNGGDWFFRSFELLVFLVALGVALDWETLRRNHLPWTYLFEYYRVADVRFGATYASTLGGALFFIVQQLQSGQASQAVTQILKTAPSLIPVK